MAITRAQQVKQMLQDGGRIGFKQGQSRRGGAPGGRRAGPGTGGVGGQSPGPKGQKGGSRTSPGPKEPKVTGGDGGGKGLGSMVQNFFKQRAKQGYALSSLIPGQTKRSQTMQRAYRDYLQRIGAIPPDTLTGEEDDLAEFFVENAFDKPVAEDDMLETPQSYGEFIAENFGAPGVMMSGNVGGLETFVTERDETGKPIKYGFRNVGGGEGGQPIIPIIPQVAQAPSNMDQEPTEEDDMDDRFLRFRAEGGPIGGIMDLETSRQMYGLGKLVKKATRAVKKIAKSPLGKAALAAATIKFGGPLAAKIAPGTFGSAAKSPFLRAIGRGQFFGDTGIFSAGKTALFGSNVIGPNVPEGLFSKIPGGGITAAIVGTSVAAGLLTPKQELQAQRLAEEEGIDIEAARNSILARAQGNIQDDFRMLSARAEGGRIGYQEGSKEPVAKKTMPLLDMGGQEMDLREEGGFVPIGRMEKADDVPARLSKNEFVFTADAVRNAGDGDVDKGAEVMYNMMKNLEAGGDVSEESQGKEGARRMFQTSQRLEEVL